MASGHVEPAMVSSAQEMLILAYPIENRSSYAFLSDRNKQRFGDYYAKHLKDYAKLLNTEREMLQVEPLDIDDLARLSSYPHSPDDS